MKGFVKVFLVGVCLLISKPLFGQSAYLELNLNNQSAQERFVSPRMKSPLEIFRVIDRAAEDKRIKGIILNVSAFTASQEHLWELRAALQEFKSQGKTICAFISAADLDTYCLASVADKIVMDELGVMTAMGYAWGRGYVRHTLDKLGIGIRELRYFTYKSAAETYTRDSLSEADRKQYGEYLDDVFGVTRNTLMEARSWTAEEFNSIINKEFMYSAKGALEKGLVDKIGREEVIAEVIKEMNGGKDALTVVYGNPETSLMDSKTMYGSTNAGATATIAVIYANGQTDMERGMEARSLARTIRKVAEQKKVKAIVLRINSPGGSAEAADYINEAVKYARKKMPVVVSMGEVAASGGYWAAMNANQIFASPYTLTGSIGVIASWMYDKGMNNKLGFSVDVMQRGDHADLMTGFLIPKRDMNAAEEERYKRLLIDMYGDFVAKVAAGRNMDAEKVEAVAQGRVFSGIGALNAGLVDNLGGLNDAIRAARTLAKIPDGAKVAYNEYPKAKFWDRMLEKIPTSSVFAKSKQSAAAQSAALITDLLISEPVLADIRYRMAHNGKVMPLLPMQ